MSEPDSFPAPSSKPGDDDPMADAELSASQERFRTMYDTIRERIALLDYLPGERLSEGDLAEEFGVSRTPLRRVLGRLEVEGLLESRHGVGTFVTSLDMDELRAVYRLRKELATLIGAINPKPVTPEILAAMADIQAQCRQVADAEAPKKAFARINIAFFWELMKLVGNDPLRDTLELYFYRTARMWPAMTTDDAIIDEADLFCREIAATINVLKHGDLDAVGHLRRCHISTAFTRLEAYVAERNAALS